MKKKMLHELIYMVIQHLSRSLPITLKNSRGDTIHLYLDDWDSDEEIVARYSKNTDGVRATSKYYSSDDSETESDFSENVCYEFKLDNGSKDWGIADETIQTVKRKICEMQKVEKLFKEYRKE